MQRTWFFLAAVAIAAARPAIAAEDLGLEAPPGFTVSLYADDSLAHDIFSMTFDSRGRVVVAGLNYVKILEDTNGDGRADRAKLFSNKPASGAHGMYFEGRDLICTGDDSVMRLRDANGDDAADGPPEKLTKLRHPEHGANGVICGPDGWYYIICGNDAGITKDHARSPRSPVKQPICGGVVRISRDGKQIEVLADGLRNPYDGDFDATGRLLTVDSDGERDHHLPWYTPTRLFDIAQGMQHGWLLTGWVRSWCRPECFFDNVDRACELGRGSPTGVVVYRHRQFPARYQGSVLSACWTMGRIYHLPLEASGATCRSRSEVFLRTTGNIGFAPCDMAVGPDGDLMVAIGGRRTQGSVFRVHYGKAAARPPAAGTLSPAAADGLEAVLAADQPLASWSRARWVPIARKLGAKPFYAAIVDARRSPQLRIRAIEVASELFSGLPLEVSKQVIASDSPDVVARVAWSISRQGDSKPGPADAASSRLLAGLTRSQAPQVQRAAWEALAITPGVATDDNGLDWRTALNTSERRVRAAAIVAARGAAAASYRSYRHSRPAAGAPLAEQLADARIRLRGAGAQVPRRDVDIACEALAQSPLWLELEAVRLLEIALGDMRTSPDQPEVFSGYTRNPAGKADVQLRELIARKVVDALPSPSPVLNRELARLCSMVAIEHGGMVQKVASLLSNANTAEDDIHYLIVLALVPGERSADVTKRVARALCDLHRKLADRNEQPSQNWPMRVGEAFEALCQRDPRLAQAVVDDPHFGRPEHSFLAAHMRPPERGRATAHLLELADEEEDVCTSELVDLVGELPPETALPFLRKQWEEMGLRDSVVLALARKPAREDREKFVTALTSPQPQVVSTAARTLTSLEGRATPEEIAAAVQALKLACSVPVPSPLPGELAALLSHWRGQPAEPSGSSHDNQALYQKWFKWFAATYPRQAAALAESTADDAVAWKKRIAKINWDSGRRERGRLVFERKACHRCHQASGQLGPELVGAVGRMSREDLLAAIVDPNKEVSPTFQTTLIATKNGQVYNGLVVYDSPEMTLLKTGPDTTVRISGAELSAVRPSRVSLMPTGLLNGVTDQEVADLFAYLKTLAKK